MKPDEPNLNVKAPPNTVRDNDLYVSKTGFFLLVLIMALFILVVLASCAQVSTRPTGRAASDQYLITKTIDSVLDRMVDTVLFTESRNVSLEVLAPDNAVDATFFEQRLHHWIVDHGGQVIDEAPTVLRVTIYTLGSDHVESSINLPLSVPTFGEDGFAVRRLSIYRKTKQEARCHVRADWIRDGQVALAGDEVRATHYIASVEVLGVSLGQRTDLSGLKADWKGLLE